MLKEQWGGVVDTVGGQILFNAVKSLKYGASLAACGLVASPQIPATVLPFILRHVNLLGIDSVQLPLAQKARDLEQARRCMEARGSGRPESGLTLETICQVSTASSRERWWDAACSTFAPAQSRYASASTQPVRHGDGARVSEDHDVRRK